MYFERKHPVSPVGGAARATALMLVALGVLGVNLALLPPIVGAQSIGQSFKLDPYAQSRWVDTRESTAGGPARRLAAGETLTVPGGIPRRWQGRCSST